MALFRTTNDLADLRVIGAWEGDSSSFNPKPPRYSATTTQWFVDCPRLYYWAYVVGIDTPPSPAQAVGTNVHAQLEKYLKEGVLPNAATKAGAIALAGLQHLPTPKTAGLRVEDPFEFALALPKGDTKITGTIDFWVAPQRADAESFVLGDHKTTGDLKWRKSEAELKKNVQANLYAFVKFRQLAQQFPRLSRVDMNWVYYQKKTPHVALPTTATCSRDEVEAFATHTIAPALEGMRDLVQLKPRVQDVPFNREHCDAYGGCSHAARCWKYAATSREETKTMGLIQKQNAAAPQQYTPPTSKPAPAQTPAALDKGSIMARAQQLAAKYPPTAVNPPAPAQVEPVKESLADCDEFPAPQAAAAGEEKPKRGRKPKPAGAEALVATTAAEVERAFAPHPTQPETSAPRGGSLRAPGANSEHSFWLFVDCLPTKGFTSPVHLLDVISGTAQADATEASGKAHFRLADYGQSHGILEAAFAKFFEETPLTGAVYADSFSPVSKNVLGLLRAHATLVIEGMK